MQRSLLLLVCALGILYSCSPGYSRYASRYSFKEKSVGVPDYSNLYYWAAHPFKQDPSDSIPDPLVDHTVKDSMADVFFLHPTSFTAGNDTGRNADIYDSMVNAKTDYSSILYQASAFNECRVFAPRYRQAHYRSYFIADTLAARNAFDLAYQDVKTAFQYYLDQYNGGRPIIIASHSQGSNHALRLLKEFFGNGELKNRLVVAYVLGMHFPDDYFTDLKMCNDSLETGCLVAWRTFKKGYVPDFVLREKKQAMVTNPLTWETTNEYAPYHLNKGAVIKNFNVVYRGITDAQVHEGVLWINRPRIPGSIFLRKKDFHIGDINLFYVNIRENVRARLRAFRKEGG